MANHPDQARTSRTHADPDDPAADLSRTLDVEHVLMHRIVVDIAIAVPVAVGVLIGMVALAVSIDGAALGTPILMAAAIGALAGVFFGTWAGFVSTAHAFEELDRTQPPRPSRPHV